MFKQFKMLLSIMLLVGAHNLYADYAITDVFKLKNDKEVLISSFNKSEIKKIENKYKDEEIDKRLKAIFYKTFQGFLNESGKQCDLRFIDKLMNELNSNNFESDQESIEDYLKLLRINNNIDDIFYEMLSSINIDYFELQNLDLKKKPLKLLLKHKELLKFNNVGNLFSGFSTWPNEIDNCSYSGYIYIKDNIWKDESNKSDKENYFKILLKKAYEEKVIELATYNKLEYLRSKGTVNNRRLWIMDYWDITYKAKNKMVPYNRPDREIVIANEDIYSSERLKRFSRLTRRKRLYSKYDETQIILLAQILQKASRRMGVDSETESKAPFITQEFTTIENGEPRTYVERIELDSQSQYNLARRLMRKDIVETQMMEIFQKKNILYEDIVMAALETGYITHQDIEFVVNYDNL